MGRGYVHTPTHRAAVDCAGPWFHLVWGCHVDHAQLSAVRGTGPAGWELSTKDATGGRGPSGRKTCPRPLSDANCEETSVLWNPVHWISSILRMSPSYSKSKFWVHKIWAAGDGIPVAFICELPGQKKKRKKINIFLKIVNFMYFSLLYKFGYSKLCSSANQLPSLK